MESKPVAADGVRTVVGVVSDVPLVSLALDELVALVDVPVLVAVVLHEPVVAEDVVLPGVVVVSDVPLVPLALDELVLPGGAVGPRVGVMASSSSAAACCCILCLLLLVLVVILRLEAGGGPGEARGEVRGGR